MTANTPNANRIEESDTCVCSIPSVLTIHAMLQPRMIPANLGVNVSASASDRNWMLISLTFYPNGFAKSDFFGAFGYGRKHHVHDADATDHKRDAGNCGQEYGEN